MKKFNTNRNISLNVLTMQIIYFLISIFFCILLYFINPNMIYLGFALMIITIVCSFFTVFKEISSKKIRVNEIIKGVDFALKENLNKLEVPMAMILSTGEIVWKNDKCLSQISDEYIKNIYFEFENKKMQNEKLSITSDIGDGTIYCVLASDISFLNSNCMLISFIDKTYENQLKTIIDNTKVSVGVVFIDNFEETFQGLDEMEKAEITSKVDKILRKWVTDNNGVINKVEKDKYVIFIEKQYTEKMEKNKFDILELITNASDKTKLPITISIGISNNENELYERYTASGSALDIALGRGGDQVVVKKNKKFDFYGGTNIGLEKTSRVRARTISGALCDIIDKSDKVYIVGHKNTDVDCIGAAVGIYKIAESLGKKAYIIADSKYNNSTKLVIDRIKNNEMYSEVFLTKEEFKKMDTENSVLVVVDTHKKTYLATGDVTELFDKIVVIDHHRRGPEFIENATLTYHEIYASSTSELVTELLMYMDNVKISVAEAEALYAGILIDTKNFSFKTGVRTFEVAAFLKRVGIDISEVKQIFQNDFETYLAKAEIVKNAEILDKQIAISICDEVFDDVPTLVAQAADELLSISGILASFVLCKIDSVIMISSRSTGDINVQEIMEKIGGGGHLTFAGAQLAGISIDDAKSKLITVIKEYFNSEIKQK